MPRELRRFMQLSLLQMLRRSKSRGTCSIARRGGLRCCAARKHATRIANGEIWLQTDALSSLIMMTVQMRMRRTTMSRSLLIHFIRVVSTQVSTILGTRGDPEKIIATRASAAACSLFRGGRLARTPFNSSVRPTFFSSALTRTPPPRCSRLRRVGGLNGGRSGSQPCSNLLPNLYLHWRRRSALRGATGANVVPRPAA